MPIPSIHTIHLGDSGFKMPLGRLNLVPEQRAGLRAVGNAEGIGLWLKFPETILAPSPESKSTPCNFRVATRDSYRLAELASRQLIFDFWSVVVGVPPPVPNVARNHPLEQELVSLIEAHALFQGIERPFAADDDGSNVLAYILKPQKFYEYVPSMVCVASKADVPDDVLFVTYVRLDPVTDGPRSRQGNHHALGIRRSRQGRSLAARKSFLSLPYQSVVGEPP
jgi:hypothetical protein